MYPSYLQVTVLICIHYIAIDHQLQGLVLAKPGEDNSPKQPSTKCQFTAEPNCIQSEGGGNRIYDAGCILGNDTAHCEDCQGQVVTISICEQSNGGSMTSTVICKLGLNCTRITQCSVQPTTQTTKTEITGKGTTTATNTELSTTPTSISTVTSAVVGTVGGLLILVVSGLIITMILLTVVSQRKRNSSSRQNNNVNSLDNPTYNNGDTSGNGTANSMQTTGDLDHTSTSHYEATEPVYHTLESPPESNNLAAIRMSPTHEYETMPRYLSPPTNENISSALTTSTDKPHPYEVIEIKLTQEVEEPQDQPAVVTRPNASYAGTMSEAKLEEMDENNDYSTLDVSMQDYAILEQHIHKEHTNQTDNNFDDSDDYSHLNRN